MVRKAKGESQATYSALLDAAECEFIEKGVTRTTLNDVASAAGLTRGAIYWHFKDKSALFQAMCDRVFLPMQTMLNEIIAAPGSDPLAALRQMMLHMLGTVTENAQQRTVFNIIFHHCEKTPDMACFVNENEKRVQCQTKMQQILQQAVVLGQLPPTTDTWLAVQALNGYLIGLMYEWLVDPNAYDLSLHAPAMTDIFLAGLLARPPLKPPIAG